MNQHDVVGRASVAFLPTPEILRRFIAEDELKSGIETRILGVLAGPLN
jgi:hypothetical protein